LVFLALLPHWDSEPYILFDPLKVEVNVIPICQEVEVDGRFVDFFFRNANIWMV